MTKTTYTLLLSSIVLACAANANASDKADWPQKPVQVLVTANAGGDTDFNARTFAKYFKKYTDKPMVVANTSGSNGMIAINTIKNSKPDGYKILFSHTGQLIVNEVSGNNQGENYLESLKIVAIPAVDKGTILVGNPKAGFHNLSELLEMSKKEPGKFVYGTEFGGYSNLQGVMLEKNADVDWKFVDSGTTSDKITALLGNRIDLAAITYGSVADYVKTGDLLALGQFNLKRNENIDQTIPTLTEAGINFTMEKPYVISLPKDTDDAIAKRIQEIVEQVAADPDYKQELYQSYKQPVEYHIGADAIKILTDTRTDFMKFQGQLGMK